MYELENLLKNARASKSIYIYGDGEVGRLLRVFLHEQGIEIQGFITTNVPNSSSLMSVPVKEIESLDGMLSEAYVILCMHPQRVQEASYLLMKAGNHRQVVIDDFLKEEIASKTLFKDLYEDVERKINILLYHRVVSYDTAYSIHVSEKNFEEQLKYIVTNYDVIDCGGDWSRVHNKAVALTFDDGYVDFYQNAFPLLKKYRVPATVFVSTEGIGNEKEYWWDTMENLFRVAKLPTKLCVGNENFMPEKYVNRDDLILDVRNALVGMPYLKRDKTLKLLKQQIRPDIAYRKCYRTMNAAEIREVSDNPLITVGAHTVHHICCNLESSEVQRSEILESKRVLERITGRTIDLFAYPNGDIGASTREILKELGFRRAFTCNHACIDNDDYSYDLPRSAVLDWNTTQIERRFRGMWQTSRNTL